MDFTWFINRLVFFGKLHTHIRGLVRLVVVDSAASWICKKKYQRKKKTLEHGNSNGFREGQDQEFSSFMLG